MSLQLVRLFYIVGVVVDLLVVVVLVSLDLLELVLQEEKMLSLDAQNYVKREVFLVELVVLELSYLEDREFIFFRLVVITKPH